MESQTFWRGQPASRTALIGEQVHLECTNLRQVTFAKPLVRHDLFRAACAALAKVSHGSLCSHAMTISTWTLSQSVLEQRKYCSMKSSAAVAFRQVMGCLVCVCLARGWEQVVEGAPFAEWGKPRLGAPHLYSVDMTPTANDTNADSRDPRRFAACCLASLPSPSEERSTRPTHSCSRGYRAERSAARNEAMSKCGASSTTPNGPTGGSQASALRGHGHPGASGHGRPSGMGGVPTQGAGSLRREAGEPI
jgi:hypothetical protein